jgi:hypothetical protein
MPIWYYAYRSFFDGKMIIDFALFAAALSNDFVKLRLQLQFLSEVKLNFHISNETSVLRVKRLKEFDVFRKHHKKCIIPFTSW